MKNNLLIIVGLLALTLMSTMAVATEPVVIEDRYAHLAICQPATGNMTEAMILHRANDCNDAMAAVDAGVFAKSGDCAGGILSTFSHDAEGNSCPKTAIDRIGEVLVIGALFVAGAEAAGADIAGSGGPINELGAALGLTF